MLIVPNISIAIFDANMQTALNIPVPGGERNQVRVERDGLFGTPRNGVYWGGFVVEVCSIGCVVVKGVHFIGGGGSVEGEGTGIDICAFNR